MTEKLHQGRGVILGVTPHDAAVHSSHADEEEIVLVATSHLKLTILGSLAGMDVRSVYITPHAAQGLNYDVAMAALERRSPQRIVELPSRG